MSARATEGAVFARHLLGTEPPPRAVDLYERALLTDGAQPLDERDARALEFAVRHPWSIGFLDAALALFGPQGAALRRRLLIAAAVLEVQPECAARFLPGPGPGSSVSALAGLMLRAAFKAAAGFVLLRLVRR